MIAQYRGYRDLRVYQVAYALALEIHEVSKSFPHEERYSMTDQIRRASRSVVANIAEAWRRRKYEKSFISKLIDSSSEEAEVEVWLEMCKDCGYITVASHDEFLAKYEEVGKMLTSMISHPEKFCH